jgi:hypothetical protein
MTSKIQPDSLATNELQQVAQDLAPWLDAKTVERLFSSGGANASKEKTLADAPLKPLPSADHLSDNAPSSPFKLQDTFAVYRLGAKSIKNPDNANIDIAALAKNTWRWHHQIKVDEQPVAFARTCASEQAGAYDVCQFFVSDLSGAVDDAITWIDKYEAKHPEYAETEPLVRLLVVPAYNVLAFWLLKQKTGQSDLLVIDALPELVELKRDQLLSSAEFLKAFTEHDPITGVVFDDEDPLEEETERGAYRDSRSYRSNALIQSTDLKGGDRMSNQEDVTKHSTGSDAGAEDASDKMIFDFPDVKDEAPLFLGFIYSATRSKGAIEEDLNQQGAAGAGEPLYSAYVFPYVPPDEPAGVGGAKNKEQPMFVAYVFPYFEPSEVVLGGGKPGSLSEVGGHPGQTLFYGRIKSFVADKNEGKAGDDNGG